MGLFKWFSKLPRFVEPTEPLVVKKHEDGTPQVECIEISTEVKGGNKYRTYHDRTYSRVRATLSVEGDTFLVAAQPYMVERVYFDCSGNEKSKKRLRGMRKKESIRMHHPADEIRRFSLRSATEDELSGRDKKLLSADKLMWMEHQIIRAEFTNGTFAMVGRDSQDAEHTTDVILALTRVFLLNRPEGGWSRLAKDRQRNRSEQEIQRRIAQRWSGDWKPPRPVSFKGNKFAVPLEKKTDNWTFPQEIPPQALDQYLQKTTEGKILNQGTEPSNLETMVIFSSVVTYRDRKGAIHYRPWTVTVNFISRFHESDFDTIEVWSTYAKHLLIFKKQLSRFEGDFDTVKAKDMPLPKGYLDDDVVLSDDALILLIRWPDGEIIPLSYTQKTPRDHLINYQAQMWVAWQSCKDLGEPMSSSGRQASGKTPPIGGREDYDPM